MSQTREPDDKNERDGVDQMLAAGTIKETKTVTESSLVAVKNLLVKSDNTGVTELSGFRTLEMPSPETSQKLKQGLLGKNTGDTVEFDVDGGKVLYVILAVYELAETQKTEVEPSPQPQA